MLSGGVVAAGGASSGEGATPVGLAVFPMASGVGSDSSLWAAPVNTKATRITIQLHLWCQPEQELKRNPYELRVGQ